jgi:hypothetical protein
MNDLPTAGASGCQSITPFAVFGNVRNTIGAQAFKAMGTIVSQHVQVTAYWAVQTTRLEELAPALLLCCGVRCMFSHVMSCCKCACQST